MKEIELTSVEGAAVQMMAEKIQHARAALASMQKAGNDLLMEIIKSHGEDPKEKWTLTAEGKLVGEEKDVSKRKRSR